MMGKELLISMVTTFAVLSIGFLLFHFGLIGYGFSFFVFLPFVLGYIFGGALLRKISLIGLLIALGIFIFLLIKGELEGMVCVLMSLPIIFLAIGLGYIVRLKFGKYKDETTDDDLVQSALVPFCLFLIAGLAEKGLRTDPVQTEMVTSSITLPYSPEDVFDAIKSVDTLIAPKPFLMHLDLPIPRKCVLEDEKVGAMRTCYFDGGYIKERVTSLERGKLLKMVVTDYQLTGRKWLGFVDAIYTFEPIGTDSCRMTRITTYTSELYPRIYWAPLEHLGIRQEHEYVFRNLQLDLERGNH